MKYLVISDIHANFPALQAVLDDAPEYDGVICLGDLIGLNGFPYETVSWVMDNTDHCIKGNHDIAVLEHKTGHVNSKELSQYEYESTWDALTDDQISWVKHLSSYKEVTDENLILAHAYPTPEKSSGIERGNAGALKKEWTRIAASVDESINFVLLGHTHNADVLDCSQFGNDVVILNPGSTGQPIGTANYGIIDTETQTGTVYTVSYDGTKTREKIKQESPLIWW